jgi:hypothetical protein
MNERERIEQWAADAIIRNAARETLRRMDAEAEAKERRG